MRTNLFTFLLFLIVTSLLGSTFYFITAQQATVAKQTVTTSTPTEALAPEVIDDLIAEKRPNVLLIILDDIGLDYFPGFLEDESFEKAPMPVTESLMRNGYKFTNLNTYSMCSPTRASIITGYHGVDTGVLDPGQTSYLDPKWQSIQNEISEQTNGEITSAVFGKWHLLGRNAGINHPNEFVDHYEGFPKGNHDSYFEWTKVTNGVETPSDTYATTDFTNAAIDWINDQDGQWFTWLAYTAPHSPIHLPPDDLHSFTELTGIDVDLRQNRTEYFKAMLESVDTEIGRLLDSIDRENTYVIIIGDNGTGGALSQEPFRSVGGKGSLTSGGIHTPMVVYSPYQTGTNTEVDTLTSTIDFFPTILDIFGLQTDSNLPGNSFYPLISDSNDAYTPNEFIFAQDLEATTVRSNTHRLIRNNDGSEVFFNLTTDPFETTDLLSSNRLSTNDRQAYDSLSAALDNFE